MGLSMPLVLKIVTVIVAISLTMWFYPFFTILEGIVNPPPCQLPPLVIKCFSFMIRHSLEGSPL